MYAPVAAAAAVSHNPHHHHQFRQSYPTLPRMVDRSRHASSNYALVGPDLATAAAPIPAAPSQPPTASFHHAVNAGPAVVQGAYWLPPLAPRLTAAAPRAAAWPNQDVHYGYNGAARHDPWATPYDVGGGLGGYQGPHQQQWNDGRQPSHAFPPHAQPHQQLEHQLLLHHYLSKLQTQHDSLSNRQQTQAYQRPHHQSQHQEQHRQQFYNGPAGGPQTEFGAYHPQPPTVPSSRQWSSFAHAPAPRHHSVGPSDHTGHDWNSHAARQQHAQANAAAREHQARASYTSNWRGSEWAQGDDWAESRGQAYREQQQQRLGYASSTWSHSNGAGAGPAAGLSQYEARAGSNASWDHSQAADLGNGFGPGGRQLPVPIVSRHHQPQPQQHYQYQKQQAQPYANELGEGGAWYHPTSHGGPRKDSVVPNLALVSPAPPPSPAGVHVSNGQGQGADPNAKAANGTQTAGPAPPSPATIDKSSVPIYEIGVELVNAVCKSVLGCVTNNDSRAGSVATETPMVMSPPSSGMMSPLSRADLYEVADAGRPGWNAGRGEEGRSQNRARQGSQQSRTSSTSRHRHGSQTQSFGGLGMYHARSGDGQGSAGAYSGSASLSASQLATLLPSTSQLSAVDQAANSSGDSSGEDSSEPGTPASSVSGDEHDEFYPKPPTTSSTMMMPPLSPPNDASGGLAVPESAPPQLRTAINLSLDQSGIWGQPGQKGSFDAKANSIAQGWATASPAMARPVKTSRKSDSHSQRPSMIGALKQSYSYSSSKTATQDMAFEDESGSGTAVGGSSGDVSSASTLMADGPLGLLSPSWPWTTVADDFFSMPMCHGRRRPFEVFTMMEDAFVFRSHLEASGAASPTLHTDIKTAFARFAHQVLSQTLLSPTAFMLGLLYILRVPSLVLASDGNVKDEARALFAEPPSAAPFKLFTLGMMIANKQLDDNTFTNRTWQEVTGIPLPDLNKLERFYLERCHFEINVPPEVWYAFLGRLRDRENERRAQVGRDAMQSPRSMLAQGNSPTLSGFDPIVSSSTSRRVSTILKTLLNGEESISPILGSVGEPALALAADLLSGSPAAAVVDYGRASIADDRSGSTRLADDPRYSAPAYHPDADVFDDDSGPFRQRDYRPHSAAANVNELGAFSPFQISRSQSDPAAIYA